MSRHEASRRGQETRKRNQEAREVRRIREEAEAMKQIAALKLVRDHPDSTPTEKLEAVKMLADYERRGYSYLITRTEGNEA